MKLSDIEEKCEEINSLRQQLEAKQAEIKKLEVKAKEKSEEVRFLKTIAKLSDEAYEAEEGIGELVEAKTEVEVFQKKIEKIRNEVLEGLKNVSFSFSKELPKVDKKTTINFKGNPCNNAVRLIASILSLDVPLKLDNVELYGDKVVVANAQDLDQVSRALEVLQSNIGRLARIALEEQDPIVEKIADYFYKSSYRDIWEAIKGRKRIANKDLYSYLGLETSQKRKRVRNFFTVAENALTEEFPFIRVSTGTYELNFLGSLVWRRYQDKYLKGKQIAEKTSQEASVEIPIKKKEGKPRKSTLNQYLSNDEIKKVIYGKEVN